MPHPFWVVMALIFIAFICVVIPIGNIIGSRRRAPTDEERERMHHHIIEED